MRALASELKCARIANEEYCQKEYTKGKTIQDEGHIFSGKCEAYEDLRTQFGDLGEDKNLVKFFQAVLDQRDVLEDEERTQQTVTAAVVATPVSVHGDGTSRPRDCILLGR